MEVDGRPKYGMVFNSFEDAWKFWVDYGKRVGFGVRKHYINKSKKDGSIGTCRFVCCKEGVRAKDKRDYRITNPRPETRTKCQARMGIINIGGKFRVYDFIEEHNHILHLPETTHMLACQRNLSEVQCHQIELADDAGLQQRASFDLMSTQVGGRNNLGYTRLDQKNYLRTRRQRSLVYGEASYLMQYFQQQSVENPSFYHAYQMDSDEQITNVFWADARMIIDYGYFGDVVCLDTTHCTNRAHRPLAVFSGFNHYRGAVVFGAALLYDETVESFKWLLETFFEAHKQKKPQTIFTDQDKAIARALREIWPETYHGLCTWHLMQNGTKHLGNLMKGESHFMTDFKKCMYEYEEEVQFEEAWSNLLIRYDKNENAWLNHMYSIKEKWAGCYMKRVLTLGIRSTQLSESINADIKACTNVTLDIVKFFKRFEKMVEEKRYNELKCEFEAREKIPRLKSQYSPMLLQMAQIYTSTIFSLFQEEWEKYEAACVKHKIETHSLIDYVITMVHHTGEWKVSFNPEEKSICCSCRQFETIGILCCHALKVFSVMDVKLVPDQYILKRWTKEARTGAIYDIRGNKVTGDAKLAATHRYREICPELIRIATEASSREEAFLHLRKAVAELGKQIYEICNRYTSVDNEPGASTMNASDNEGISRVKGFKRREGKNRSKRFKSCLERGQKRKKHNSRANASQNQQYSLDHSIAHSQMQYEMMAPPSDNFTYNQSFMAPGISQSPMQYGIPCSTPPMLNVPCSQSMDNESTLTQYGFSSYTSFLLAQLDQPGPSHNIPSLCGDVTNLSKSED